MEGSNQLAHPANGADANVDLNEARQRWREDARCRGLGSSLFFPESEDGPEVEKAKSICAVCPVITSCLEYAKAAREEYGVWGGTTARERRQMRRRRHRKTA